MGFLGQTWKKIAINTPVGFGFPEVLFDENLEEPKSVPQAQAPTTSDWAGKALVLGTICFACIGGAFYLYYLIKGQKL